MAPLARLTKFVILMRTLGVVRVIASFRGLDQVSVFFARDFLFFVLPSLPSGEGPVAI